MPKKRANGTDRALYILECLARLNRPISRTELVQETGFPRSTVYALTEFLLERQWLAEQPEGVVLGVKAGFSSNAYLHQQGFERLARKILNDLSSETGTLSEIDVVDQWAHVVALSEGRLAQGYLRPVEGARLPLMPTAAARVLLADVPEEIMRRNIPESAMIDASGTPLSWDSFLSEVNVGRFQGYVLIKGWLGGIASTLACPIMGPNGQVLASLCLIVNASCTDDDIQSYVSLLHVAAQKLSALIRQAGWPYAENCKRQLLGDGPQVT